MLSRLTYNSLCLFRNKHALTNIGRANLYRFQNSSVDYKHRQLSTQCNVESRCIRDRAKLLEINTWRIHKVPTRNFRQIEPEPQPFMKSNPKEDGLSPKEYELIYINDIYLVMHRAGDILVLMIMVCLPLLCYKIYTDFDRKDVNVLKPMDIPEHYKVVLSGAVFFSLFFASYSTFRRSPFRIYKQISNCGVDTQYVAILSSRIFSQKQMHFGINDYKETVGQESFARLLLFGNVNIKKKGYVIFGDYFVSQNFHNELRKQ